MADETLKTLTAETQPPLPPPPTAEEQEAPQPELLEPMPEPPLASVSSVDLQKDQLAPPPHQELPKDELAPPADEQSLKESVTVIETDTPLHTPATEQPLTAATTVAVSSQPLSAALAVPQESESKAVEKSTVGPGSWRSFKEESNKLADLSAGETLALTNLKNLLTEAVQNREFAKAEEASSGSEQVSIWGVPLLEDERTDVVLLKFLRARDFKEKDAFAMLKNTIKWRRDFNVDELLNEDLGDDLEKVVFMHGHDKEGHTVCYNVYGEFQNKELYAKTFGDEEKRTRFLRWRIQFLERSIRKLDFWPGGVNTIFQVTDLKNSPGPAKRELRIATRQALQVLQDNYPEFVAKQVFINVPWWHLAFYTMISPFLTQRMRSKFVFASPAKTPEMLFKYVKPEQVPTQYGGLSVDFCECNPEFTVDDPATEIIVKPATKQTVEIIVNEQCILVWEIRVVGWEVSYSAEYVPNAENAYTVIIQKARKMSPVDEPVISSSFKITDLGKILLTVDNPTAKKKKLLYRFKVAPLVE